MKFLVTLLTVFVMSIGLANTPEPTFKLDPALSKPSFLVSPTGEIETVIAQRQIQTPWTATNPDDPFGINQVWTSSGHTYTLVSYGLWEWKAGDSPFDVTLLFSTGQDLDTFKPVFGPGIWGQYSTSYLRIGLGFNLLFQDDQAPDPAFGLSIGAAVGS